MVGLKLDAKMDKNDRTRSSVQRVASSGLGVDASAIVILVGVGWKRLAVMKRAIDEPMRDET